MTLALELLAAVGLVGWPVGISGYLLARRWMRDCQKCRIIIAVKGRVQLDASLVEWLAWNKALPKREQGRGGVIFQHSAVRVALARPKIGAPAAEVKTRKVRGRKRQAAQPVETIGA